MYKKYRIVDIPNEYSVVVNAGTRNSIKRGDKFEVFVLGKEIIDPETKEILGTLDQIKAVLAVIDVYENMCLCENSEIEGGLSNIISVSQMMIGKRKSLEVEKKQISFSLSPSPEDARIKIGDLVRKCED